MLETPMCTGARLRSRAQSPANAARPPRRRTWLAGLCALLVLGGCGPEAPTPEPIGGCTGVGGPAPIVRPPPALPLSGSLHAQEVWITYDSPAHAQMGRRMPRTREAALELAHALCRRARAGESLGALARRHSGAPGAVAQGYAGVLPRDPVDPDPRDLAVAQLEVGEISPVLDWNGGFWFAARVSPEQGRLLRESFERYGRLRARARVIAIGYAGAYPDRYEFREFPRDEAEAKARRLIDAIQRGETFDAVAREHSNDGPSRLRGGLLMTKDPVTGAASEWLYWGDPDFPQPLLEAALETAPVGRLLPTPIVTESGVFVLLVEERRE